MNEPLRHPRAVQVVGVLYIVTGIGLLLSVASAVAGAALLVNNIPLTIFVLIPLGVVLLISGVGLLGHHAWGWHLGLLISLSGIAVIGYRLLVGEEPSALIPPLVTDVLVTILLIWAWSGKGRSRPDRRRDQG